MVPKRLLLGIEDLRPIFGNPGPYTFSMYLDGDFARQCRAHEAPQQVIDRFNEHGAKIIGGVLKDRFLTPYTFLEGSLLLAQCNLGREGRWLSAHIRGFDMKGKAGLLEYVGHNIDTPDQAYALMSLMATWTTYAEARLLPQ